MLVAHRSYYLEHVLDISTYFLNRRTLSACSDCQSMDLTYSLFSENQTIVSTLQLCLIPQRVVTYGLEIISVL